MASNNLVKNLKHSNLKPGEYILLKSKDDLTLEHNKSTPLYKLTGFSGTAGEAIQDYNGKIILFVDPRYHIQAENETKGKNVEVVKLDMKTSFIDAIKTALNTDSATQKTLFIPSKSTKISTFKTFERELEGIDLKPYDTKDETECDAKIESVPVEICGVPYEKKIEKLRRAIKKPNMTKKEETSKGQNILLTSLEDVSYILNLRCYAKPNTSVIRAKMLITLKEAYVFSDCTLPKLNGIKVLPFKDMAKILNKIDDEILIDENNITLNDYNLVKKPAAIKKNPVQQMASIKNAAEIKHYKKAFKRLDDALYSFRDKIKPGLSEFELKEIFEEELIRHGANGTSFKTILAVGENSSSIHYSNYSKERKINPGEILLIDCGGYYEGGYATDITRVFVCPAENSKKTGGKSTNCKYVQSKTNESSLKIPQKVKEIYTIVLKAQLNVFFKDFAETKQMDALARKILKPYEKPEKGGFLFPHSLGHGVGIPVHQAPPTLTLNPKFNCKLQNNMVFTIEPGLYNGAAEKGNFGIRLENTVYYDKKRNKKVTLSQFPYEEDLIDKTMLNKKEQKWLQIWQEGRQND